MVPAKGIFLAPLKMVQNKGWASLVSAAAVIPAPRVVGTIIGPKASVAGHASLPLNPAAQRLGCGGYYVARRRERQAVLSG